MTHEEIMLTEKERVQKLLTAALDEIEANGGMPSSGPWSELRRMPGESPDAVIVLARVAHF